MSAARGAATVYVIGAGGHGKVVADALLALGHEVEVLDDERAACGERLLGVAVRSEGAALARLGAAVDFVVAIGDNRARASVAERWLGRGHRWFTLLHPRAVLSAHATVDAGACVLAGAIVQPGARVGSGVIVNTAATIDHDCVVGESAHIAPGAHLAGNVHVGARAWVGLGSNVREGTTIGADTLIGAGSLVLADVPAGVVAYGSPCRTVRPRS